MEAILSYYFYERNEMGNENVTRTATKCETQCGKSNAENELGLHNYRLIS